MGFLRTPLKHGHFVCLFDFRFSSFHVSVDGDDALVKNPKETLLDFYPPLDLGRRKGEGKE